VKLSNGYLQNFALNTRKAGMGDRLIHNYDEVNLDRVWETAQTDVPDFLAMIEPLLPVEEE
jgi:uncharacterized protein with HEPN domain